MTAPFLAAQGITHQPLGRASSSAHSRYAPRLATGIVALARWGAPHEISKASGRRVGGHKLHIAPQRASGQRLERAPAVEHITR